MFSLLTSPYIVGIMCKVVSMPIGENTTHIRYEYKKRIAFRKIGKPEDIDHIFR
jgi:hypothetical protein